MTYWFVRSDSQPLSQASWLGLQLLTTEISMQIFVYLRLKYQIKEKYENFNINVSVPKQILRKKKKICYDKHFLFFVFKFCYYKLFKCIAAQIFCSPNIEFFYMTTSNTTFSSPFIISSFSQPLLPPRALPAAKQLMHARDSGMCHRTGGLPGFPSASVFSQLSWG